MASLENKKEFLINMLNEMKKKMIKKEMEKKKMMHHIQLEIILEM